GAPPYVCPVPTGVFQWMVKFECHFINGTEKVRYVVRPIYNRQQYAMFDSDVGHFVGYTPQGEKEARYFNTNPKSLEYYRTAVDWFCRVSYEVSTPFLTERRVTPSPFQSLLVYSQ
ncbi:HB2L protein, partial [Irena cyanogastra]|nr:HB2L protein [Irena cyanogastra]